MGEAAWRAKDEREGGKKTEENGEDEGKQNKKKVFACVKNDIKNLVSSRDCERLLNELKCAVRISLNMLL